MKLHYDYITGTYSDRRELVEGIAAAIRQDRTLTFDVVGRALETQGMFPASSVTLALMSLHNVQGQQTFVVGEHLASMLEHTNLEGTTVQELRLPYSVFYVALPGCTHRIWGGTRTQWHTVEGMYVHLSPEAFTIMAWAGENERSLGHGDDAHIWVRLNLFNEHGQLRDEDLETMVYRLLHDMSNERNDPIIDPIAIIEGAQDDGIDDAVRAVQTDTLTAMYRIAVNLSLYLTSEEPETAPHEDDPHTKELRRHLASVKSDKKRKKIQRQLDRRSKATIVHVGRTIEQTATAQVREYGTVKAHWVRGHYHHYWTGKGRTIKVRKWIMPYPKGMGEPEKRRDYDVRSNTSTQVE